MFAGTPTSAPFASDKRLKSEGQFEQQQQACKVETYQGQKTFGSVQQEHQKLGLQGFQEMQNRLCEDANLCCALPISHGGKSVDRGVSPQHKLPFETWRPHQNTGAASSLPGVLRQHDGCPSGDHDNGATKSRQDPLIKQNEETLCQKDRQVHPLHPPGMQKKKENMQPHAQDQFKHMLKGPVMSRTPFESSLLQRRPHRRNPPLQRNGKQCRGHSDCALSIVPPGAQGGAAGKGPTIDMPTALTARLSLLAESFKDGTKPKYSRQQGRRKTQKRGNISPSKQANGGSVGKCHQKVTSLRGYDFHTNQLSLYTDAKHTTLPLGGKRSSSANLTEWCTIECSGAVTEEMTATGTEGLLSKNKRVAAQPAQLQKMEDTESISLDNSRIQHNQPLQACFPFIPIKKKPPARWKKPSPFGLRVDFPVNPLLQPLMQDNNPFLDSRPTYKGSTKLYEVHIQGKNSLMIAAQGQQAAVSQDLSQYFPHNFQDNGACQRRCAAQQALPSHAILPLAQQSPSVNEEDMNDVLREHTASKNDLEPVSHLGDEYNPSQRRDVRGLDKDFQDLFKGSTVWQHYNQCVGSSAPLTSKQVADDMSLKSENTSGGAWCPTDSHVTDKSQGGGKLNITSPSVAEASEEMKRDADWYNLPTFKDAHINSSSEGNRHTLIKAQCRCCHNKKEETIVQEPHEFRSSASCEFTTQQIPAEHPCLLVRSAGDSYALPRISGLLEDYVTAVVHESSLTTENEECIKHESQILDAETAAAAAAAAAAVLSPDNTTGSLISHLTPEEQDCSTLSPKTSAGSAVHLNYLHSKSLKVMTPVMASLPDTCCSTLLDTPSPGLLSTCECTSCLSSTFNNTSCTATNVKHELGTHHRKRREEGICFLDALPPRVSAGTKANGTEEGQITQTQSPIMNAVHLKTEQCTLEGGPSFLLHLNGMHTGGPNVTLHPEFDVSSGEHDRQQRIVGNSERLPFTEDASDDLQANSPNKYMGSPSGRERGSGRYRGCDRPRLPQSRVTNGEVVDEVNSSGMQVQYTTKHSLRGQEVKAEMGLQQDAAVGTHAAHSTILTNHENSPVNTGQKSCKLLQQQLRQQQDGPCNVPFASLPYACFRQDNQYLPCITNCSIAKASFYRPNVRNLSDADSDFSDENENGLKRATVGSGSPIRDFKSGIAPANGTSSAVTRGSTGPFRIERLVTESDTEHVECEVQGTVGELDVAITNEPYDYIDSKIISLDVPSPDDDQTFKSENVCAWRFHWGKENVTSDHGETETERVSDKKLDVGTCSVPTHKKHVGVTNRFKTARLTSKCPSGDPLGFHFSSRTARTVRPSTIKPILSAAGSVGDITALETYSQTFTCGSPTRRSISAAATAVAGHCPSWIGSSVTTDPIHNLRKSLWDSHCSVIRCASSDGIGNRSRAKQDHGQYAITRTRRSESCISSFENDYYRYRSRRMASNKMGYRSDCILNMKHVAGPTFLHPAHDSYYKTISPMQSITMPSEASVTEGLRKKIQALKVQVDSEERANSDKAEDTQTIRGPVYLRPGDKPFEEIPGVVVALFPSGLRPQESPEAPASNSRNWRTTTLQSSTICGNKWLGSIFNKECSTEASIGPQPDSERCSNYTALSKRKEQHSVSTCTEKVARAAETSTCYSDRTARRAALDAINCQSPGVSYTIKQLLSCRNWHHRTDFPGSYIDAGIISIKAEDVLVPGTKTMCTGQLKQQCRAPLCKQKPVVFKRRKSECLHRSESVYRTKTPLAQNRVGDTIRSLVSVQNIPVHHGTVESVRKYNGDVKTNPSSGCGAGHCWRRSFSAVPFRGLRTVFENNSLDDSELATEVYPTLRKERKLQESSEAKCPEAPGVEQACLNFLTRDNLVTSSLCNDVSKISGLGMFARNHETFCLTNDSPLEDANELSESSISTSAEKRMCLNNRQHVGRVGCDEYTAFDPLRSSFLWKRCGQSEGCSTETFVLSSLDGETSVGDPQKGGRIAIITKQDRDSTDLSLPYRGIGDIQSWSLPGILESRGSSVQNDGKPKAVPDGVTLPKGTLEVDTSLCTSNERIQESKLTPSPLAREYVEFLSSTNIVEMSLSPCYPNASLSDVLLPPGVPASMAPHNSPLVAASSPATKCPISSPNAPSVVRSNADTASLNASPPSP